MTYARLVNKDGKLVAPDAKTFQAAAASADWAHAEGYYLILTNQAGPASWPITGRQLHPGTCRRQGQQHAGRAEVLRLGLYPGQALAEGLDYVPMPANVIKLVEKTWQDSIKGERRAGLAGEVSVRIAPPHRRARGAGPPGEVECRRMAAVTVPYKVQLRREARAERLFRLMATSAALLVLALLAGVLIALAYGAWPALRTFSFGFLTNTIWNPVTEQFGAFAALYGTVITSLIAHDSFDSSGFRHRRVPDRNLPVWLRAPIGTCIELLAAVPSIVFGIWGLFVLAPVLQHSHPALADRGVR